MPDTLDAMVVEGSILVEYGYETVEGGTTTVEKPILTVGPTLGDKNRSKVSETVTVAKMVKVARFHLRVYPEYCFASGKPAEMISFTVVCNQASDKGAAQIFQISAPLFTPKPGETVLYDTRVDLTGVPEDCVFQVQVIASNSAAESLKRKGTALRTSFTDTMTILVMK